MNLNVSQDNLYLFLPSKVSWMAEMLSEEKNVSIADAIQDIRAPIADWRKRQQNFGI